MCGRCDAACMEQKIAHWYKRSNLDPSIVHLCMHCGQCVTACPYNTLHEKLHFPTVYRQLNEREAGNAAAKDKVFVATTAPAVRVSLGELFGLNYGSNLQERVVGSLRELGFDYVFDTTFGADLVTKEETAELRRRLDDGVKGPMFTSCCPAWVTFVETFFPELIPQLSTTRSPILAQSAAIKTYFAKEKGIDPKNVVNVAIAPCVGKKYEATRPENVTSAKYWKRDGEFQDLDYVLTTREIGSWFAYAEIDPTKADSSECDPLIGSGSGAGTIFGSSGGVTRAVARQFYRDVTGEAPTAEIMELKEVDGVRGLRETTLTIGRYKLRLATVCGLDAARELLESGKLDYDLVEVMACPGGCVGGGGQPKLDDGERPDDGVRSKRAKGLQALDQAEDARVADDNPELQAFYENFVAAEGDATREALFHTTYQKRDVFKS